MITLRDYELLGVRPKCQACRCELDPEEDCYHDGYMGSPYAHGGRGSYGLGSHHYKFNVLCSYCRETRTAPLRTILAYNREYEWLECGHKTPTPHNRWGFIRPGKSRRCEYCRVCAASQFDPVAFVLPEGTRDAREYPSVLRWTASCMDAIYSDDEGWLYA